MNEVVEVPPGELLCRARRGDGRALGRLLEIYRAHLILLARVHIGRRLQVKVDASDVVQEAFLGAWRDFAQFRGTSEQEFVGWLRQIVASLLANLVRHYQRTQARDIRRECHLPSAEWAMPGEDRGLAADQSSPSEHAIRREQTVLLAEALGRLPELWRELLILRHLEGLSFPEVAARMGRSLDSVKKHWPRALASLRRLLEERTT